MTYIRSFARFLIFTSSGAAVFALYLIVPSLITAHAVFPAGWTGIFIAFASLAVGEVIIYAVLLRTTRRASALRQLRERRAWMRHAADFNLELSAGLLGPRLPARAANASARGMAVVVEPDEWDGFGQSGPIQLHVPGLVDAIEAKPVGLERIEVDGRTLRLLRLRLSEESQVESLPLGGTASPAEAGPRGAAAGSSAVAWPGDPANARRLPAALLAAARQCGRLLRRIAALFTRPLWLVLTVQVVASLSIGNTAFQDEATYLYAGRQIVHHLLGGPTPTEWVGDFLAGTTLYPTIGGAIDLVGGLEAARLFSLFWMLCATIAVYATARMLYDRSSGYLAAALFGIQGSVLFVGHFATFDAMAVGLLGLAMALAVYAGGTRTPLLAPCVSLLLLVAGATTYVSFLYFPTILLLLCWRAQQSRGWLHALLRMFLACLVLGGAGVWAIAKYPGGVGAFDAAILHRNAADPASTTVLVQLTLYLSGIVVALALVGLLLSRGTYILPALLLLGSSLAAPAYHIVDGEFTSLQKHVAYGLLFAAPLAGFAVTRLQGNRRLIGVVLCLMVFPTGYQADQRLFDWWPNVSPVIAVLHTQVQPGDRILAEEHEVLEFYLARYEADLGHIQWSQTYGFAYTDSRGRYYSGIPAYRAAIADGYFDLVVLRYGPTAALDHEIDGGLRDGTRYELVAKIPYTTAFGSSAYYIWRRRPTSAAAAVPARGPVAPALAVHNELHTVRGGRVRACDLSDNTHGAVEPGCEIVSVEWLPRARVTYTLRYPNGSAQTFVDTADGRGHSLHPFAVSYRPPPRAVHGQPSTVASILVTAVSRDGSQTASADSHFAVMP